jgi:hypothetical protein
MDNGEIRNRVLVRLYRKYYGIWLSSAIDAEQVVRHAAILSENSDLDIGISTILLKVL